MNTKSVCLAAALAAIPIAAQAQKWEIGGVGGGSFYTSRDATRSNGTSVQAGFSPGFAAGAAIGQNMGRHYGGEIRYTFQSNSAQLSGNGTKATFGAQSHAIHYDILVYTAPPADRARPYFSFGAGVKQFRGTGTEGVTQPLSEYALLTKTTELVPLVTFGAGVKVRLGAKGILRLEVKDYLSPIAKKVITPNRNVNLSGWVHNILPVIGLSYSF